MSKDSGQIVASTPINTTELIVVQVVAPAVVQPTPVNHRLGNQLEDVKTTSAACVTEKAASAVAQPFMDVPFATPSHPIDGVARVPDLAQIAQSATPVTGDEQPSTQSEDSNAVKPGQVPFEPATPELAITQVIEEADRETLANAQLFKLFQQRLCLAANLGLLLLPFFMLIFAYLSPTARRSILTSEGGLMLVCVIVRGLAPRVPTLLGIRLLTLAAYALFSMGSAAVVAQMSADPILGHNQIIAYAGHHQIMLSTLLLPFTLMESLTVMIIAMGSLAWATWWTADPGQSDFYLSQLFVFETTALFVACIAHFQDKLRRQAFDATFDLAHHAAQAQRLSTVDQVTGGSNRRHLETMLAQEIARAARFAHPLSVIMFDLDNFKRVNDTQGHRAGDEVLRQVWQMATSTVREIDAVARYGGDEFTVVLPETAEPDAHAVAERLLTTAQADLKRCFGPQHPASAVTLSIGLVTFYLDQPIPTENVLEQADQRLYAAKRSGKNQIAIGVVRQGDASTEC